MIRGLYWILMIRLLSFASIGVAEVDDAKCKNLAKGLTGVILYTGDLFETEENSSYYFEGQSYRKLRVSPECTEELTLAEYHDLSVAPSQCKFAANCRLSVPLPNGEEEDRCDCRCQDGNLICEK